MPSACRGPCPPAAVQFLHLALRLYIYIVGLADTHATPNASHSTVRPHHMGSELMPRRLTR
ncbi:hypothetical protein GCM10012280_69200 [Wenjunlia tyrosinilytica]|uniref:Uncharacterized protein n=1 Tax=Wenjunlia tyrosinilytica TaxID=1544741 RepID=A0A918E2F9_9ACTN|nr:hypothetical protein GCM10012280_69200 [Wenjunlia tyrosinilytica]